jgi:hypothetical protein
VAGGVVVSGGIAGDRGPAQLEDVPVAVHAHVIGDVHPPPVDLVIALMLAKPRGDDAVVVEGDCGVVNRHPGDGVRTTTRQRRTRTPGITAQQSS